jgi:hypothetical protein
MKSRWSKPQSRCPSCSENAERIYLGCPMTTAMIWTRCGRKWVTDLTDTPSFEQIGALVVQLAIKCRKISSIGWTDAIRREASVHWGEGMVIKWKSAKGTGWTDALDSSIGALVVYWCRSIWSWRRLKIFSTGWTDDVLVQCVGAMTQASSGVAERCSTASMQIESDRLNRRLWLV